MATGRRRRRGRPRSPATWSAGLHYVNGDVDEHGRPQEVARWLGNTPAACRSSYIRPAVLDEYSTSGSPGTKRPSAGAVRYGLGVDEQELLVLLHRLESRRAAA